MQIPVKMEEEGARRGFFSAVGLTGNGFPSIFRKARKESRRR